MPRPTSSAVPGASSRRYETPLATITDRASITPSSPSRTARTGPRTSSPVTERASTISAPNRETCAIARWARSAPLSPRGKPR